MDLQLQASLLHGEPKRQPPPLVNHINQQVNFKKQCFGMNGVLVDGQTCLRVAGYIELLRVRATEGVVGTGSTSGSGSK